MISGVTKKIVNVLALLIGAGALLMLEGCHHEGILAPAGLVAKKEQWLLIGATLLMLIIVIPVIIMNFLFAWRYRASNKRAKYSPQWGHSNLLELICWTVPIIIIGVLATATWVSTRRLDPYRPLSVAGKPMIIEAVALNWKWLFIYPQQNIATINWVQMPVNTPIRFRITSDAPMNSFAIPRLAGQIYAMAGMGTNLNLIASQTGDYRGLSTNYSGDGFSGMYFTASVSSREDFNKWVRDVKRSPNRLSAERYETELLKPTAYAPKQYFSSVDKRLFHKIIMKYMDPSSQIIEGNVKQKN